MGRQVDTNIQKAIALSGEYVEVAIRTKMNGYEQETDAEIFNELRPVS